MITDEQRQKDGHRLLAAFMSVAKKDRDTAIAAADVALEFFAPTMPEGAPIFTGFQEEADWWANLASDSMISAVMRACTRRVTQRPMISPRAKKMALVAIWNTLGEKERADFLDAVDPGPGAKG